MEEKIKNSFYEMRPLTAKEISKWKKCSDEVLDLIRVGPQGYILPAYWLECAEDIRNMPVRPTDTFVVSYPRSGTTWTQELVWLLRNNFDFAAAKSTSLTERYAFLEFYMLFNPLAKVLLKECTDQKKINTIKAVMTPAHEILAKTSIPRFIKSHQPMSLLPEGTLDTAKVVYVARDPRDVAVSCYHFYSINRMHMVNCEFKEFFNLFIDDLILYCPFFEHIKEAWARRHHPNMLFLFYEELFKDLKSTAKKVADFIGKTYTEEQYEKLCEHLEFKNFQNNKAVSDLGDLVEIGVMVTKDFSKNFVRKGKAGGWRDYFDADTSARAQAWIDHNLQDTDFRFPN